MIGRNRLTLDEIKEYLKAHQETYYHLDWQSVKSGPKCSYCDENGYLTFTAPNGETRKEICSCQWKTKKVYSVLPIKLVRIEMSDKEVCLVYDPYPYYINLENKHLLDPPLESAESYDTDSLRSYVFSTVQNAIVWAKRAGLELDEEYREGTDKQDR